MNAKTGIMSSVLEMLERLTALEVENEQLRQEVQRLRAKCGECHDDNAIRIGISNADLPGQWK